MGSGRWWWPGCGGGGQGCAVVVARAARWWLSWSVRSALASAPRGRSCSPPLSAARDGERGGGGAWGQVAEEEADEVGSGGGGGGGARTGEEQRRWRRRSDRRISTRHHGGRALLVQPRRGVLCSCCMRAGVLCSCCRRGFPSCSCCGRRPGHALLLLPVHPMRQLILPCRLHAPRWRGSCSPGFASLAAVRAPAPQRARDFLWFSIAMSFGSVLQLYALVW